MVLRSRRGRFASSRASGGDEAVEEDEPLHVVDHVRHADLHRGAGDADGSDEEVHLILLHRKHMLHA